MRRWKTVIAANAICLPLMGCAAQVVGQASDKPLSESAIVFEASTGETVDAYSGVFRVPENRSNPDSRDLTLHYVRFPATRDKSGPPIVYLAGGPGGSGVATAEWRRFPLFMAMREFGDVIALDQRGTGASNDLPNCISPITIDAAEEISEQVYIERHQAALEWCLGHWRKQSFDYEGYTTIQSVADLEALRVHLNAEKLTLWGTSYGSHLALAAAKQMEDRIERIVVSSVEGLNQTIKRPARTDAYLARLQAAIDKTPDLRAQYPDLIGLMNRVHEALDEQPIRVRFNLKNGEEEEVLIQSHTIRTYASGMVADPENALLLLSVYKGLDAGDTAPLKALLERWYEPEDTISYRPMSTIMDIASGITPERREQIFREAESSILRSFLNFTIHLFDVAPELDLGDRFRSRPVADIPLLVLSGTLDGRTYVESQLEATEGFVNRHSVIIENAGHNLFMSSPEVTDVIESFMNGEDVDGMQITIDLSR